MSEANPWVPVKDPLTIKTLGKLQEELGECTAAASRCLIQGIAESEPSTGKVNKDWLRDEIADVLANIELVTEHLDLDRVKIIERKHKKIAFLKEWHSMTGDTSDTGDTSS